MFKCLTLILTLSILHSLPSKASEDKSDWKTMQNPDYELQYPADYQLVGPEHHNVEFYLMAPLTSSTDGFADNISLAIEPLTKANNTLSRFAKASEQKIEQFVNGSEIISQKTIGKKKKAYHRIEYSADYPNTDGVYWLQYYFLKNGNAYIVTATIEENQKEIFIDVMTEILDTFKVKKYKKPKVKSK